MLVDALLEALDRSPETIAVQDGALSLTYRRLALLSGVFRDVIERQTRCRRVGLMLPASALFPAAFFGALWSSKIAVPLNFLLGADELADVVRDAGLDLILSVRNFQELCAGLEARTIFVEDLPLKRRAIWARWRRTRAAPRVNPDDTAVILYTSGTAGRPKGVQLTCRNLHSNAADAIASLNIRPPQTLLNVLPPFHVFGLTDNVLVPVMLGASVAAIPRFNPVATARTIQAKRVTVLLAIPSMYAAVLRTKSTPPHAFRSVILAVSGGEPLPDAVADGFERRFGLTLRQGYGLTETSPVVSACSLEAYRKGTVGRPIRNVSVRIVTPDGDDAPAGADGEIVVRGPGVMKGYYRKPEMTRQVIDADGWFHTGDVGRIDSDGFLSIAGRLKELLIIGGENVAPREIEAVLETYDGVMQAAVIGAPDSLRGEVPVAFIIPQSGAEMDEANLRRHAKKSLAGFKVPRRIIIREDLPKSPTGKILKRRLREFL